MKSVRRTPSKEMVAGLSFSGWCARACMVCGVVLMVWPLIELVYKGQSSTARSAIDSPHSSNPSYTVHSDTSLPATPPHSIIDNPVSTGQSSAGRRGRTRVVRHYTEAQKAEQTARMEILTLYEKWKGTWDTENVGVMMSLYSPRLRFRNIGGQLYDYNGFREWLRQLWQQSDYPTADLYPPELVIRGNRAVLEAEQSYGGVKQPPQYYRSRYVWEKQRRKTGPRWLIIEEVYLPSEAGQDVQNSRMMYDD
jgi:hypothetical protein